MSFNTWIKLETGLSLYDFCVLDLDGTAERQVKDLFNQWLEECNPTPAIITEVIYFAAQEGFNVCAAV